MNTILGILLLFNQIKINQQNNYQTIKSYLCFEKNVNINVVSDLNFDMNALLSDIIECNADYTIIKYLIENKINLSYLKEPSIFIKVLSMRLNIIHKIFSTSKYFYIISNIIPIEKLLLYLMKTNYIKIVTLFLEYGYKNNLNDIKYLEYLSKLWIDSKKWYLFENEGIKLLLEYGSILYTEEISPITNMAYYNNDEGITLLLKYGFNINEFDKDNKTLLDNYIKSINGGCLLFNDEVEEDTKNIFNSYCLTRNINDKKKYIDYLKFKGAKRGCEMRNEKCE